jgi:hypothetical protein
MIELSKLGISPSEYGNLIKVRDMLAASVIPHNLDQGKAPGDSFNMYAACRKEHNCGTAMCIGGWIRLFELDLAADEKGVYTISEAHQRDISGYVHDRGGPIRELFWPKTNRDYFLSPSEMRRITPAQAVKAIDNFLHTGKPYWHEVIRC